MMHDATALLISRCPSVIQEVKGIAMEISRLRIEGCSTQTAGRRAGQPGVGLILAHLGANEESEIAKVLWSVAHAGRSCPVVLLCDQFEEHQVAALLRAGAADYVVLPSESKRLGFLLSVLTHRLRAACNHPAGSRPGSPGCVVEDGIDQLMGQVRRIAPQDSTVLVVGETGVGKTRLARQIHELSPRRGEPFMVVDCGSLSETLIESELFGHVKGAFTGADRDRPGKLAAAGGGTLLLDEVNSLPLPLQSKLLRAVDERVFVPVGSEKPVPMRARLVAASNVLLEQEVQAGRFRADLFYRLNVVGFCLPALRDRSSSILPLARRFLQELIAKYRPDLEDFSPAACSALEQYDWPGNVRELRNVVERAVALCPGRLVERDDLPEAIRRSAGRADAPAPETGAPAGGPPQPSSPPLTLHQSKDEAEIRRVREALLKHNNKRAGAARELGISRVGLYKKLHKFGMMGPGPDTQDDVG